MQRLARPPPRRRKRRGNVAAARRASLDGLRAAGKGADEARKSAHALAAVLRAQGNEADAAEAEASVA